MPAERKSQLRKYVLDELENSKIRKSTPKKSITKPAPSRKAAPNFLVDGPMREAPVSKIKKPILVKDGSVKRMPPPQLDRTITSYFGRAAGMSKKRLSPLLKVLALALLILILVVAVDIFGAYQFSWHDPFSQAVAKILFLPAGSVNGKTVGLAGYLDDLNLLESALKQNREGVDGSLTAGKNDAEKIFNRLISLKLIDLKLAEYKKSVTESELNQGFDKLVAQIGSRDKAAKDIRLLYGLDLNQFKVKVLKPVLARENLQEAIISDDRLAFNQAAKDKANEVLNLALNPKVDFATLATQYTEDEAGINIGGEMSWVTKGELSPELEPALFSTADGKVYPQIVKNNTGYHILKVEKKLVDPDTGKESVKARQILIKVDVDKYIKSLMDSAAVKRYVK